MSVQNKVMEPTFTAGIFPDVPNEEYHQGAGISNSGLSVLNKSPLHYWQAYLNPERERRAPTPAMEFGTAIHAAILEPDRFRDEYVAIPHESEFPSALVTLPDYKARAKELEIKGYSTGTKDEIKVLIKAIDDDSVFFDDEVARITNGKTAIKREQMIACHRISQQIYSKRAAKVLFSNGAAEQSIYWKDADTGVLCRIRPDYLSDAAIPDVKSTEDASPAAFQRSIWTYRYWVQAAMYIDGVKAATGEELPFVFCAWEKAAPYAAAFYSPTQEMIEAGRKEYKRLLRVYAACMESGEWDGYSESIMPIELPVWGARELEGGAA
jgi:PDDEXK-like domain of unknown function (DUF3799)